MNLKIKYGLALKVLVIVLVLVAVKVTLHYFGLEYIALTTLFATVVGGAIFLVGLILTGTLSDYKESEKLPSEITASLESVWQEGNFVKAIKPDFDVDAHRRRLLELVRAFRDDLKTPGRVKKSVEMVERLSDSMVEMERLGVPAGYISRIKGEQGNLNKNMLRAFQIKETSFISAAYAIVEIISVFMVLGLMLLKLDPFYEFLLTLAIIIYIFLYMIFLVEDLDDPFQGTGGYADVDMFLLDLFEKKVER